MSSAGTGTTGGKGNLVKPAATAGEGGDTTATGGSGMIGMAGTDAQGDAGATTGPTPQVVGKQGGVVMQEGVTLDIPANALATNLPITVMSTQAPAGYELVSEVFQFGPDGTTFSQPVAVTIPLKSAAPGAHVFWSNANNGFDDIGGTVNGLSATAYVTHFSRGFAAVPMHEGGGGAGGDNAGGAPGAAGMGGADVGGTAGTDAGGTSGAGAGGSGGASGGSGGSGGTSGGGAGGSGGMSGGGGTGGVDTSALCNNQPLNLPIIKVTNVVMGSPPDSSTYTGGSLPSGNYLENGVTHYGPLAYSGPQQAQYKIDPVAQTIQIGERMNASTYYIGMTYTVTDSHTLHATVVCNTTNSPSTIDYAYTYTVGNPSKLTMTAIGSLDVMTFIAP